VSLDQDLGERIRSAREAHGWTQDQLAEAVGVVKRTVGNWERGRPPKQHIGAIEHALNTRLRGTPTDPTDDGPTVRQAEDAELLAEFASRLAASRRRVRELEQQLAGSSRHD
jgi:transcriptional regulator with XRE-family HTH domain